MQWGFIKPFAPAMLAALLVASWLGACGDDDDGVPDVPPFPGLPDKMGDDDQPATGTDANNDDTVDDDDNAAAGADPATVAACNDYVAALCEWVGSGHPACGSEHDRVEAALPPADEDDGSLRSDCRGWKTIADDCASAIDDFCACVGADTAECRSARLNIPETLNKSGIDSVESDCAQLRESVEAGECGGDDDDCDGGCCPGPICDGYLRLVCDCYGDGSDECAQAQSDVDELLATDCDDHRCSALVDKFPGCEATPPPRWTPCETAADCADGELCARIDGGGICTVNCYTGPRPCAEDESCIVDRDGFDMVCGPRYGLQPDLIGCTADTDCGNGLCTNGRCLPLCNGIGSCAGADVCVDAASHDTTFPVCEASGNRSVAFHTLPLFAGSVTAGTDIGPFNFTIPKDALSFIVYADSSTGGGVEVSDLRDVTNRQIFSTTDYSGFGQIEHPRTTRMPAPSLLYYPNSPAQTFRFGRYAITLRATEDSDVEIKVVIKTARDVLQDLRGRLNVNVFFVGLPDLDVASTATNEFWKPMLDELLPILDDAGVSPTSVSYFDVAGAAEFTHIDTTEGADSELRRLFRTPEAQAAPRGLNLFVVQSISDPSFGDFILGGYDGSIPGSPWPGSGSAGIAMAALDWDWTPRWFALTTAHEIFHYLGLYHTTELNGVQTDQLLDTPECGKSNDKNFDEMVDIGECTNNGGHSLMFWMTVESQEATLTRDQKWVIYRHPMIY